MQVYKITNRVTGQSYIGATKDQMARIREHRGTAEKGLKYPLAVAIREYGWGNFDVITLAHCQTVAEAHAKERAAIALFDTLVPRGYNQTPGGPGLQGREVSAATRERISNANKGRPFVQSPEAYAKLCARAKERRGAANIRARRVTYHGVTYACILDVMTAHGLSRGQMRNRFNAGLAVYVDPPKCKVPVAAGKWNLGKIHSAETRARMGASKTGAKNWNARVIEVNGVQYPCTTDAMRALGVTREYIRYRIRRGLARYLTDMKHLN